MKAKDEALSGYLRFDLCSLLQILFPKLELCI
jgi:hypothetical protein